MKINHTLNGAVLPTVVVFLLGLSSVAQADNQDSDRAYSRAADVQTHATTNEQVTGAPVDQTPSIRAYAKVISSAPVYREERIAEPRQECHQEQVNNTGTTAGDVAGTVLGGVIGGVAGHQVGGGRGKDLATAAGAIVGAYAGHSVAERIETPKFEQRCTTINDSRVERRLDGYNVAYKYNGQIYHSRLNNQPGSTIPVRVRMNVTPE